MFKGWFSGRFREGGIVPGAAPCEMQWASLSGRMEPLMPPEDMRAAIEQANAIVQTANAGAHMDLALWNLRELMAELLVMCGQVGVVAKPSIKHE